MRELVPYILGINISITIFFVVYLILYRKDSNFAGRRFFLLFAMAFSFLIPLIRFEFMNPENVIFESTYIFEGISISELSGLSTTAGGSALKLPLLLLTLYVIVTLFLLAKLLLNIFRILRTAVFAERITISGRQVCISSDLHASSFFNHIFIAPEKVDDNQLTYILEHETGHVGLIHSFDRILVEIMVSLAWMNPLVWKLKRSVVANNEYQADNRVIDQGNNQIEYQLSILNQFIGSASISNKYSNQIKNRITMLNKKYKKGSAWKNLMLFPVSIMLLLFIGCGHEAGTEALTENEKMIDDVFYVVEEMPKWPGEDDFTMAVRKFIATNLKYPEEAHKNKVEGKIFVQFMVTKTGKVIVPDPSMLPPVKDENDNIGEVIVVAFRPLDKTDGMPDNKYIQLLKNEGVRVIELMPELVPGKQRGQEVNVLFTMPIIFKLQ